MGFELINPVGLEKPVGYAHVAKITGGTVVHVAGQAPFDERGQVVGKDDFVAQFRQVVQNLNTAIQAVGGRSNQYAVLTIYVTNLEAYWNNTKLLGSVYREVFSGDYPRRGEAAVQSRLHDRGFRDCSNRLKGSVEEISGALRHKQCPARQSLHNLPTSISLCTSTKSVIPVT